MEYLSQHLTSNGEPIQQSNRTHNVVVLLDRDVSPLRNLDLAKAGRHLREGRVVHLQAARRRQKDNRPLLSGSSSEENVNPITIYIPTAYGAETMA